MDDSGKQNRTTEMPKGRKPESGNPESQVSPRAPFRIQCDGSSRNNPGPAGIGVVVIDPVGTPIREISYALGIRTNNQAEYEALIRALTEVRTLPRPVVIQLDSELLIRQLEGSYRVRNELLKPLYERARSLLDSLDGVTLQFVLRGENKLADRLARAASRAALEYEAAKRAKAAKSREEGTQRTADAGPEPEAGCLDEERKGEERKGEERKGEERKGEDGSARTEVPSLPSLSLPFPDFPEPPEAEG